MSAEQPWMKFYPSDWRADQALRVCSLAARGLWIECMCIMHEADPYGFLIINNRAVTDAQLALLTGTPPEQISDLLGELESAGVFSRNLKGVVFSRRMTRDKKKSKNAKKNGKNGGNPSLCKTTTKQTLDNLQVKPQDKGGDKTHKPEARGQKETPPPLSGESAKDLADEIWRASGKNPDTMRANGKVDDIMFCKALLDQGHTADQIADAARAVIARTPEIRSLWGLLKTALPEALASEEPTKPTTKADIWEQRKPLILKGIWMETWNSNVIPDWVLEARRNDKRGAA